MNAAIIALLYSSSFFFSLLVLQNLEMRESIGLPVVSLASKLGPSHCGEMPSWSFKMHRCAKIDARPFSIQVGSPQLLDTATTADTQHYGSSNSYI